jgi:hypothetical protein
LSQEKEHIMVDVILKISQAAPSRSQPILIHKNNTMTTETTKRKTTRKENPLVNELDKYLQPDPSQCSTLEGAARSGVNLN